MRPPGLRRVERDVRSALGWVVEQRPIVWIMVS